MTSRKGKHASPDNTTFYKSLALMILGIVGVGVVVFGLLYLLADSPPTVTPSTPAASATTTTLDTTTSTSSTTSTTAPTTTTVPVRTPAEVRVQVLNSMGLSGAAGRLTARLAEDGYQTLQAADYSPELSPSRIWYRPGFSAEAAILLEYVPGARVEELPDPSLSEGADVLIVLGTGYEE